MHEAYEPKRLMEFSIKLMACETLHSSKMSLRWIEMFDDEGVQDRSEWLVLIVS